MLKRITLAVALLAAFAATRASAQNSYTALDSTGATVTFKSLLCGGQICPITVLADTSGGAIYGAAGTANANVMTVQGIAGGTVIPVSLASTVVSGTVTANQGGTWNITNVSGTITLPTGAATSANQTSQITQETAINTVLGVQADAAWSSGSGTVVAILKSVSTKLGSGINANGQQASSASSPVVIALDQSALPVGKASSTGGASPASAIVPNNTTGVLVKNTAGTIYGVQLAGIGSAPAYLKIYDSSTAPTCGSGTPIKRLMIPAAATAANGAGSNITFGPAGLLVASGVSYCVTTGIADNDTTAPAASTFLVNIDYK